MTSTSYNIFPKSWLLASTKVVKDTSSDLGKVMEKVNANGANITGYEERSLSGGFLRAELRWFLRKSGFSKD
ncbi:MAG: hypothetical protein ICV78_04245 [Tolypothrix sp. Co-bin9]|nr:hypothetical protein [Tolypothrix sp. Co-bin9]